MIPAPEVDIVKAFVLPAKRERCIWFLSSPKRRPKFVRELYHFKDFDPACIVPLPRESDSAAGLLADLRRRGAGQECYVMSVWKELDGVTRGLAEAINEIFGLAEGTIVSCVAGSLAYYEGEPPHNRFLLHRPGAW